MASTYDTAKTVELVTLMGKVDETGNVSYKCYTHCGSIHKDDVASCAAASLLVGDPTIVKFERIDNKQIPALGINDSNALLLDVGKGRFDHHFDSKNPEEAAFIRFYDQEMDLNGNMSEKVEMSAIARLWDYAGTNIVHETILHKMFIDPNDNFCKEVANKIENVWIKPISDTDTKGQVARPNFMSANVSRRCAMAIALKQDINELFYRLVDETREELSAYIITIYNDTVAKYAVEELASDAADDGHPCWINLTDAWAGPHIPANLFKGTTVRFVVESSIRVKGEWNVNAVDSINCPIKDEVKSIEGFKFLHDKRFCATFLTKEAAEQAARVSSKDLDIWC